MFLPVIEPLHFSQRNESFCPPKNLYMIVYQLYLQQSKAVNNQNVGEWLNKLGNIHTTESYSAIKMNEPLIHATLT